MDVKKQFELIKRGTAEIISEKDLLDKLHRSHKENKPLKIKAGFDPSAPDIHLGHTVLLRKLRDFQNAGHKVYFLIGDFTGRIGDPTGQSAIRKQLTKAEVMQNAKTYEQQVFKILDRAKTEVVFNSQWFDKMPFVDVLKLTSHSSVAQMLARADFKERFERKTDISILEFMYPLLQAYDSVMLEADVEVGGTDQKFNLLKGRELQADFKQPQQAVVMMPLLVGTDGVNKMSKSLGNYVGINDSAKDIFGKIMSIKDEIMPAYFELLTDVDMGKGHPKDLKMKLAGLIVEQYYGRVMAEREKAEFESVFKNKNLPKDLQEFKISADKLKDGKIWIVELMELTGLSATRSQSRRLIEQGGVCVNEEKISDANLKVAVGSGGVVLKVGKRGFVKIVNGGK